MINLDIRGAGHHTIDPRKIIAVGLNYKDHLSESATFSGRKLELPSEPVIFAKTPNVLCAHQDPIVIPAELYAPNFEDARVDHEAELAIVMGKKCSRVSEADALDHVMGYTCFNDVTQRNIQKADASGWFRGKSLDGFGPIGPCLVPPSHIGDPQNLTIQCRVNGELKQNGNTSMMIFSLRAIIAYISKYITLLPGDIISTGTPSGVSALKHGDVVEVEIENIGILRNPVLVEGHS